jgi:hypothetical protein
MRARKRDRRLRALRSAHSPQLREVRQRSGPSIRPGRIGTDRNGDQDGSQRIGTGALDGSERIGTGDRDGADRDDDDDLVVSPFFAWLTRRRLPRRMSKMRAVRPVKSFYHEALPG